MKRNLGKYFILCYLGSSLVLLFAEEFSYDIHVDTQDVYLKEGILLTVDFKQTDPKNVLLFQFAVNKSKTYLIYPLYAQHDDTLHATVLHNTFRVYPLQTGDINITFSFTKRVTNDDKVAYFASGDRDDFKKLETKDIPIPLTPLTLHVKALPEEVKLVGDFHLKCDIDTFEAEAFTPIPMRVTIEGVGYPPTLNMLYKTDKNYTLFAQEPEVKKIVTKEDINYTVSYIMALSASKDFTLPKVTLPAFNPKTKHSYILTIPPKHFHIKAISPTSLIDMKNIPPKLKNDWSWIQKLFMYPIVFFAGYLTALTKRYPKKKKHKEYHSFVEKIQNAQTAKALLQLLMAQENKHFELCIEQLEASLYGNTFLDLKKIKKEALEKLL